jgi:hypothetical protein
MCLITHIPIDGNIYLAKNRDRYYITPLKAVRVRRKGVEILYILDTKSGWVEGINEHGICLVNSVLPTTREEKIIKSKESKFNSGLLNEEGLGNDGSIILNALSQTRLQDAVSVLVRCQCRKTIGLHGHTIVTDGKHTIAIEYTHKSYPRVHLVKHRFMRANHTVNLGTTEGGYDPGRNIVSFDTSHERVRKIKQAMKGLRTPEEILPRMAVFDSDNPCESLFRVGKRCDQEFQYGFATTSQILMDPSKPRLVLRIDPHNTVYSGLENLLGSDHHNIIFEIETIERAPYAQTVLKLD